MGAGRRPVLTAAIPQETTVCGASGIDKKRRSQGTAMRPARAGRHILARKRGAKSPTFTGVCGHPTKNN
ncbi:hypothetical protein GCM10011321_17440 [Youhaiella tibetensis]|nr:hypothetical protein GCM10011321_17440 [Youhaiella tibetensis]